MKAITRPPARSLPDRRLAWYGQRLEAGAQLQRAGRLSEALHIYQEILRAWPDCWAAIFQLGTVLYHTGMLENAELLFRRVVREFATVERLDDAMKPLLADTFYNLGLVVQERGRLGEAVPIYLAALEQAPQRSEVFVNLGTALLGLGRHDLAVQAFDSAAACPDPVPETRYNRGLAHILMGRWREGWADFEYRWQAPSFRADYTRDLGKPRWQGEPTDEPLLLWSEQGFGDTLMMLRYVAAVKARAPQVALEVQPSLVRLVRGAVDVPVVGDGEPLPPFARHAPLMSLPHLFATMPETVPSLQLAAPAAPVPQKIGLCWAGTTKHRNDRHRSIPLPAFWPLFEIPGLTWQALQLERTAGLDETPVAPLVLPDGGDWLDTAAVVASCDLVITVDTGVAHLAGLLGRPTWLLLSAWPDFRWMLDRADTPWYPSVRLFRQSHVGDWTRVIRQVRQALEERCHAV